MPHINILSPHVADLIAAGEVVERPASAVKELLENAVDAGAKTVVAEIRAGGRELIRVTDDGCGMAPEDAGVCFLRHATSKLADERGLEAIGTLGFRGEALAAIASVSRIELTTRQRGASAGVRMTLSAGEIDSMEETGCPEGTTIRVRDLFYNTPARQKFLGSDRSEAGACLSAALRCALGRPEVSFRFLRDGREEFFTPGDGKPLSAIYALLGRDMAGGLLPVDTVNDGVGVTGFVTAPAWCRGNRGAQYFFVNGRPIRSKNLQAALEQAYKNTAMVGKFPGCVLYIQLPNGLVDVNVHPTKAEVKFAREKSVFDGVYYGTLSALGQEEQEIQPPEEAPVSTAKAAPKKDFFRSMDAETFRKTYSAPAPVSRTVLRDAAPYRAERNYGAVHTVPTEKRDPAPTPAPPPVEPEPEQTVLSESFTEQPWRLIGEALGLYILIEQGDKLILIDKHAAHERILFDKMRLNEKPLMAQELLLPVTLRAAGEDAELLEANREALERLGFTLESFGGDAFVCRTVPADLDENAAGPLLEELLEKLREGRSLSAADVWERLAATVACKAAVKANTFVGEAGALAIAEKVMAGEVTHCPHGRPVKQILTRAELDRRFGRIQ